MTRQRPEKRLLNLPAATTGDAQVVLYLYELRRERTMRDARHFISADFWPESAEDVSAWRAVIPAGKIPGCGR